jgi:hypothetical protein
MLDKAHCPTMLLGVLGEASNKVISRIFSLYPK